MLIIIKQRIDFRQNSILHNNRLFDGIYVCIAIDSILYLNLTLNTLTRNLKYNFNAPGKVATQVIAF